MIEKRTNEQAPDRNTGLIKFFEERGYENVRLAESKNFNDIFYATKDGQRCFIKKYNSRSGSEEVNLQRANSEMACYENLPEDILIDVVEINTSEKYLVLKDVEFEELERNQQYVEEFVELGLGRFPEIDASFLPEVSWEDYKKLFTKLRELEAAGIIEDADTIIAVFEAKKDLITRAKKIFSHQDFNRLNIKKVDGKLKVFDFELSKQDNAMVDMATIYIDIREDEKLVDVFEEKARESELYDEELLNLMIIRRAVIVMYAYMDRIKEGDESRFLQDNLEAFRKAAEKIKNSLPK